MEISDLNVALENDGGEEFLVIAPHHECGTDARWVVCIDLDDDPRSIRVRVYVRGADGPSLVGAVEIPEETMR